MFLSLSINIFYFASSLRMISTFRMITKIIKQLITRNKEIDIDEYIFLLGQEILIFIWTHPLDLVMICISNFQNILCGYFASRSLVVHGRKIQ